MRSDRIDDILAETLDDLRLSRAERRALTELLSERELSDGDLSQLRSRAFEAVRARLDGRDDRRLLSWLEEVLKAVRHLAGPRAESIRAEARFTPEDRCADRVAELFDRAGRRVDVCVFTITDDRISKAILRAHRRGVRLRVITDDEKVLDPGNDVERFLREGIDVRTDTSPHHMHDKFALFDRDLLVTGSYNWTRSASEHNEENFIVTSEPRLVEAFAGKFEELWRRYAPPPRS